ncbi:MAG: phage major capsid protein [Rhodobacteraceae bacterium]|nr:phage major capsid protein [Paracoccaceae bacterium]
MLDSVKIQRRQSEIRQNLAELVGKEKPTEDETRSMEALDAEYRTNETRYRAALTVEDEERRAAGADLETRSGQEWSELMGKFELRQVALALDEGRTLDGATAEIVQELRSQGGFRGVPVPWDALEMRSTVAAGVPDPMRTMPIIDRLFADSVAMRMGAQMVAIDSGSVEWPVATQGATAAWQATEGGNVGGPTAYQTTDKPLKPDSTLGVQMRITRKALKQSGAALEAAIRRDVSNAIRVEMDKAVFLGTGNDGQPLGVITGAGTYGIQSTDIDAAPTWSVFRAAVVRFMLSNAVSAPSDVRALVRPEVWDDLDAQQASTSAPMWEWDRIVSAMTAGNISLSSNALAAPAGDPVVSSALLTTNTGGQPPIYVGLWGAVDMIRDPFTDAQSGGLRVTGLATMDVTVSRPAQLQVLNNIQRFVEPE